MTNTPNLEHWTVDMITCTQHSVHTAKLEQHINDLEIRVAELERVIYEKVDRPFEDYTETTPIQLVAK